MLGLLFLVACRAPGPAVSPVAEPVVRELGILQWTHFVPRYDEWFDSFAQRWGKENGVAVTVDHVDITELSGRIAEELALGQGHDLMEHVTPASRFDLDVVDLADLNQEAQRRFGSQVALCANSSFNPNTGKYYGFCHGWVPDPGNYRKSLWASVGQPQGPSSWEELAEQGTRIKEELSIQMGIGLAPEIDSNMAVRALLWSYGASVQDEDERVVINSPETVAAVRYMVRLYQNAMSDEVFNWEPVSNNKALVSDRASYILNSISAYRTAQKAIQEVADDVYFTPPLKGPGGDGVASAHVFNVYIIPQCSPNADLAQGFLLDFTENYSQAVLESELYNFPAFPATVPELTQDGGWLDHDPFESNPSNKLALLKTAHQWSTNVGHPGPANAAVSEVFSAGIIPEMFAKAARGEMTLEESVAWAEGQIRPVFEKWRSQGLVGGAD